MPRHRSTLKNHPRKGLAATEFAVCLPVLVLLLLGMIETCSMIFLQQTLATAAYEGAHTAVLPSATAADVRSVAAGILDDRRVRGGVVEVVPGNLADVRAGEFFEVRVSAPSNLNAVLPGRFFTGRTLTATAVFVNEL